MATAALPYHEPGIVTILVLSSFLILSNVVNFIFDRLLFCGLIGQIAIGVAWGIPGGNWLPSEVQNAVVQLGYLGLILIVCEGGLQTDLKTLKSNLFLSCLVAMIGIGTPMALSFTLRSFMDITSVQAFAAGAALCSTSLGTTFTILSTSGLNHSRLGVVLSSAAMMDDVVGLVMSGIIASLGQSSENFSAITVIRPVFVSVAFGALLPLICALVVKPVTKVSYKLVAKHGGSKLHAYLTTTSAAFCFHVMVLAALITGAIYAGTSGLFAAYLAGAAITWWNGFSSELREEQSSSATQTFASSASDVSETYPPDHTAGSQDQSGEQVLQSPTQIQARKLRRSTAGRQPDVSPPKADQDSGPSTKVAQSLDPVQDKSNSTPSSRTTSSPVQTPDSSHLHGTAIFATHFGPALHSVLKPFFFASIGFSIPISRMFSGSVVWRGVVYSILMIIAKLLCGLCLIRFTSPVLPTQKVKSLFNMRAKHLPWPLRTKGTVRADQQGSTELTNATTATTSRAVPSPQGNINKARSGISRPLSLYPSALLGFAMVARGEIGFLISAIAESEGVFSGATNANNDEGSSELFLVVTWAILLCTLLGPIVVGTLVRRVQRLQKEQREKKTGRGDPLGIWGVLPPAAAAAAAS